MCVAVRISQQLSCDPIDLFPDHRLLRSSGALYNHSQRRNAVTIEGVGTCSDALNRGAADLAREYDSLFVLHKSTSEAEVELELKVFGERPVAHMHHRRPARPGRPAQPHDQPGRA